MSNFEQQRQNFLKKFIVNSSKLVQYGLAYLFIHPEFKQSIDRERENIRTLERLQRKFPSNKAYFQRTKEQATIDYILKLTNFAFLYVKHNPETYSEISKLQELIDDYDKLKSSQSEEQLQEDPIWDETFNQINELNQKLDGLRIKLQASRMKVPCIMKTSCSRLKKMNEQFEQHLKEIELDKESRRQRKAPVICASPCNAKNSVLKKFNKKLEYKLQEIIDNKHLRRHKTSSSQAMKEEKASKKPPADGNNVIKQLLKPPKFSYNVGLHHDDRYDVRQMHVGTFVPKKPKNESSNKKKTFAVDKSPNFVNNSDNDSSEYMIDSQKISEIGNSMPLTELRKIQLKEIVFGSSKKKEVRIGNVERNFIIPVIAEDTPKITPRFFFTKSKDTGNMRVDLKLNFDDGVVYQNIRVDGILIENAMPAQNFQNKNL